MVPSSLSSKGFLSCFRGSVLVAIEEIPFYIQNIVTRDRHERIMIFPRSINPNAI
ncbi:protein of unknown function [Rhodovastum atsumiense]|nr:protein of unknown function [Rhodovastum atsumiense]